jgi:hypothetical protein
MQRLNEQEINRRLISYESPEVTKELYQFGTMLLTEIRQRNDDLDAKATKIAGYSGGVLTLLFSTFNIWGRNLNSLATVLSLSGIACVFAAGLMAILVWSITKFSWFSENEWFREECLSDADRLQRYHILTMHGVFQFHESICSGKAKFIRWSGYVFTLAYILILCAIYVTI